MTAIGRAAVVLALALGGAFALPRDAAAHALLQSSAPAPGSTVPTAPDLVTLTFGETPDPKLSTVRVLDASGRDVGAGPAIGVPGHPDQLQVALGSLPDGVYTVSWRTVSAVDGHAAAGSFAFGVGVTPADGMAGDGGQAPTTSPSASPASTAARFLLYIGLIGAFGVGFVGAAVVRRPPRSFVILAALAWLASTAGAIGVVAIQVADAGVDLGTFASSALGAGAASRLVVEVALGLGVGLLAVRVAAAGPRRYGLVGALASLAMLVDVVNGHAAAGSLAPLQIGAQWIHIVAAGTWLGGLAALLIGLRGASGEEAAIAARRFSRWAGIGLAAIAVTGLIRAVDEVGSIEALVSVDFGWLVIAKSGLLAVLAALGAFNHFVSVPRAIATLTPLRRVGRVEVGVGAVAVLATALLVNLVPPSSVAATPVGPAVPPVVASGSDFGTTVRVRLVVTPGTAGLNQFAVAVTDFDTGEPVPASDVTVRFDLASATGVGGSNLRLAAAETGSFSESGGNLSLDGIWKLTAVVAGPSATLEVPLALATRLPDVHVETTEAPGVPTIYTAHLSGGTTLQVYLDPGGPGANELHATFFDAAGAELPVPSATDLISTAGGRNAVVVPRQLEPGHFVADLEDVGAGLLGVDVVGAAPDGTTLHAHFDIPVPG